ncbi:hypothetical protein K239x_46800 [Planctomycetes bacterium K23_9]|uniref:Uncharacterized protein n=1 Tax=Stieleria marina TaxID=1930275 RepID=A0A517NZW9_9BACT|nr:hypothetical protein K239x_46800 [Planctomycetes bacterium K23_9]
MRFARSNCLRWLQLNTDSAAVNATGVPVRSPAGRAAAADAQVHRVAVRHSAGSRSAQSAHSVRTRTQHRQIRYRERKCRLPLDYASAGESKPHDRTFRSHSAIGKTPFWIFDDWIFNASQKHSCAALTARRRAIPHASSRRCRGTNHQRLHLACV